MAKNKIFAKGSDGAVEFNMTPMIDCTFLLIIFFILSASVLSDALAELELHRPYQSQANDDKELNELPNRIIVNVVSDAKDQYDEDSLDSAQIKEYMINGAIINDDLDAREALIDKIRQGALGALEKGYDEYFVEIRADKRVKFGAVQKVLKAAAAASAVREINLKMNLTALIKKK